MKIDFIKIGFWISLIMGIILLLWNVFGQSPTEFLALVGLIFMVLFYVIKVDKELLALKKDFYYTTKNIFEKLSEMKNDIKGIKNEIKEMKNDIKGIKSEIKKTKNKKLRKKIPKKT